MSFAPLDLLDPEAQKRRKKMEEDIEEAKNMSFNDIDTKKIFKSDEEEKGLIAFSKNELICIILISLIFAIVNVAAFIFMCVTHNRDGAVCVIILNLINIPLIWLFSFLLVKGL